ncbi:hypothetical protein PCC7418_3518 [Halothece sp. PCC 7418]|uniref:hypothetical protein n=1 Tax=Halothece sp. (strain PCC 7418) TaxID=65093 RepID=UPI0002A07102|nr:hypothetical protein [Halothece sp. PCC 7418]AFZ45629.1 hypothetical protein PCC7418_3518 [Halothece sp. PCC 7418]
MEIVLPYILVAVPVISLFFGIIQYALFHEKGRKGLVWGLLGQFITSLLMIILLWRIVMQTAQKEDTTGPTAIGLILFLGLVTISLGASFLLNVGIVFLLLTQNKL